MKEIESQKRKSLDEINRTLSVGLIHFGVDRFGNFVYDKWTIDSDEFRKIMDKWDKSYVNTVQIENFSKFLDKNINNLIKDCRGYLGMHQEEPKDEESPR